MRYAIVPTLVLAFLAFACDGDSEETTPTATSTVEILTATATATPELAVETLAFIRDGDIWLIDANGSNERRLNLTDVQSFTWISTDELDVVTGGDPLGHLLVDLVGRAQELGFPTGGSWSGDGTQYVVSMEQQIVVFERDGGESARLDVGPSMTDCGSPAAGVEARLVLGPPAFLPDGESILVAVNCWVNRGAYNSYGLLYEATLDGQVNRALPGEINLRGGRGPRISPAGTHFAETSTDGLSLCPWGRALFVAAADGSSRQELATTPVTELFDQEPHPETFGGVTGYDWSPASDAVIASREVRVCGPDVEPGGEPVLSGLYILMLDGSPEEQLVDGPTRSPAWSPSGELVAYVPGTFFGEPTESPVIRLLDLTTREITDLAEGTQPAWQPQQ